MSILAAIQCDGDGFEPCKSGDGLCPRQVVWEKRKGFGTAGQLRRYVRQRGWQCGDNDRCPSCSAAARRRAAVNR